MILNSQAFYNTYVTNKKQEKIFFSHMHFRSKLVKYANDNIIVGGDYILTAHLHKRIRVVGYPMGKKGAVV